MCALLLMLQQILVGPIFSVLLPSEATWWLSATVASQQEGPGFDTQLEQELFSVEFACSPRVCVCSLWGLRLPPTVQICVSYLVTLNCL